MNGDIQRPRIAEKCALEVQQGAPREGEHTSDEGCANDERTLESVGPEQTHAAGHPNDPTAQLRASLPPHRGAPLELVAARGVRLR